MNLKHLFIISIILIGCENKKTELELCFNCVENKINSDSIIKDLMNAPLDSYPNYGALINQIVVNESKSSSICSKPLDQFLKDNNTNSTGINNLILFQQFQAYLKHEKFNKVEAKNKAILYMKNRQSHTRPVGYTFKDSVELQLR